MIALAFSFSIVFTGCATRQIDNLGDNEALLVGYSTPCRGKMRFAKSRKSDYVSHLVLPVSSSYFYMEHETEPAQNELYSSNPNFVCYYRSLHKIEAKLQPDKAYRVYSYLKNPESVKLSLYRYIDQIGPEAKRVKSKSEQLSVRKICRYNNRCNSR